MILNLQLISQLALNTLFTVKWSTLQHAPDYIKVASVTNGVATVNYYDSTGTTIQNTITTPITTSLWLIDLTS